MKQRKMKSVIRKIVIWPILVFSLFTISMVIFGANSYVNMQNTIIQNNISAVQISINQLENLMNQLENRMINYVATSIDYIYIQSMNQDTPREKYFTYMADLATWLDEEAGSYQEIEGTFGYYDNMDMMVFRGISNSKVHGYIREFFNQNEDVLKQSSIVNIDGEKYIMVINRYGKFYNGYWIQADELMINLGLNDKALLGEVYFMDEENQNTIGELELNEYIVNNSSRSKQFTFKHQYYRNYVVQGKECNIYMGLLMEAQTVIKKMPAMGMILFLFGIAVVLLAPVLIFWLETKIAIPIKAMNDAMEIVSKGDVEYRITYRRRKYDDEFDRMFSEFNDMMDKLNELEFNLYKTKIKEQRTELKYISQQIRPHFILNALNIIYTYEQKDFALVQKMVLYLTDYFRYIVNLKVDFAEVEKELHHVETYLNIQKERYMDKFDYFVEWENQVKDTMVPPLIIQTFVENCIKYGMKNDEKTFIYVLASEEDGRLRIMVADTGNGFPLEIIEQIETFIVTREYQDELGVGIQNAIERMDILYDQKIEVKVKNALSGGAVVEIYLPLTVEG